MARYYVVYDGRARHNFYSATALDASCDTLEEAMKSLKMFQDGPVNFDPVIFSFNDNGDDRQLEYDPKEEE